jgi:hypothetical protein
MWVIVHMLTGLALGSALGGPWWFLFPLALVAHVVIDLIPHWDYTRTRHRVFLGVLVVSKSLVEISPWQSEAYSWDNHPMRDDRHLGNNNTSHQRLIARQKLPTVARTHPRHAGAADQLGEAGEPR